MKGKAKVKLCREEGKSFKVRVRFRQRCVMSPRPFDLFNDGWGWVARKRMKRQNS